MDFFGYKECQNNGAGSWLLSSNGDNGAGLWLLSFVAVEQPWNHWRQWYWFVLVEQQWGQWYAGSCLLKANGENGAGSRLLDTAEMACACPLAVEATDMVRACSATLVGLS